MVPLPREIDTLIEALPDLVALVSRTGVVIARIGGGGNDWPISDSSIAQLVRRSIALRKMTAIRLSHPGTACTVRAFPVGPERAVCVFSADSANAVVGQDTRVGSASQRSHLDRRGFRRRFKDSIAHATLHESPLAVGLIVLDGLAEISRLMDSGIAEQVVSLALARIPEAADDGGVPQSYLGQFDENTLALIVSSSDRDAVETRVRSVCSALREPVKVGDAQFFLTPCAGVAILGRDASTPRALVEHGRTAAAEARRSGSSEVGFFSDTLKLRSLARLDRARELREAIENDEIGLRYGARCDLSSGQLKAAVAYLQWRDPLGRDVPPAQFLSIAQSCGLSAELSRRMLDKFALETGKNLLTLPADVMFSFGPLRHHILDPSFIADLERVLSSTKTAPSRFEIRIDERSYVAADAHLCIELERLGVSIVIDELARRLSSLDLLARAPLTGLQLDRSWVASLESDACALKVCRAGISVAHSLDLIPIATGIDDDDRRRAMIKLGCRQGLGDLFGAVLFNSAVIRSASHFSACRMMPTSAQG